MSSCINSRRSFLETIVVSDDISSVWVDKHGSLFEVSTEIFRKSSLHFGYRLIEAGFGSCRVFIILIPYVLPIPRMVSILICMKQNVIEEEVVIWEGITPVGGSIRLVGAEQYAGLIG